MTHSRPRKGVCLVSIITIASSTGPLAGEALLLKAGRTYSSAGTFRVFVISGIETCLSSS
eukprot:scaffold270205_cov25-Prasinocladus_malaysianus.AAC.1